MIIFFRMAAVSTLHEIALYSAIIIALVQRNFDIDILVV